jgi:hypothetical protein
MVMVREVAANDWQVLRDIRLEALSNAPEAFGFALTGERQPLPSNPALGEIGMARPLRPG